MSSIESVQITCPNCDKTHSFCIFHSVNVSNDPELKQKIISKELFNNYCDNCNVILFLRFDLLYHDMENKIAIYLIYHDSNIKNAKNGLNVFENFGYNTYIVRSVEE